MIYKLDKNARSGFTLIELIIAISILAILALVVGPYMFRYVQEARISRTEADLRTYKSAVDTYYAKIDKYPTKLEDLISKPADVPLKKWVAKFLDLDEIPKDAWGNEYVYKVNPKGSAHPYDLYSYGPDGETGESVISVWER